MRFYTIYLSCQEPLYTILSNEIRTIDDTINVSKSSYVELTVEAMVKHKDVKYDLPRDKEALYVAIIDKNILNNYAEAIHTFLDSTCDYFICKVHHESIIWSKEQVKEVAKALVERVDKLNAGFWLGGEINV